MLQRTLSASCDNAKRQCNKRTCAPWIPGTEPKRMSLKLMEPLRIESAWQTTTWKRITSRPFFRSSSQSMFPSTSSMSMSYSMQSSSNASCFVAHPEIAGMSDVEAVISPEAFVKRSINIHAKHGNQRLWSYVVPQLLRVPRHLVIGCLSNKVPIHCLIMNRTQAKSIQQSCLALQAVLPLIIIFIAALSLVAGDTIVGVTGVRFQAGGVHCCLALCKPLVICTLWANSTFHAAALRHGTQV